MLFPLLIQAISDHMHDCIGCSEGLVVAFQVGWCRGSDNCSLCIIKPHAVLGGKLGQIISRLMQELVVTAMQTRHFDVSTTAELFELYKRVLPPSEFSSMVEEVSSGIHQTLHI